MQYAVIDLGFGDAGKGTVVNRLCHDKNLDIDMVVRFNGGPQAAHNVTLDDGRHHEFRQFGSGTLAGVDTFLSRHMIVDPLFLEYEARLLANNGVPDALNHVWIDQEALMVTPYHARVTQALARATGHGSTGVGISAAVQYAQENPELAPRMSDLNHIGTLGIKMGLLRTWSSAHGANLSGIDGSVLMDQYAYVARKLHIEGEHFLEAQGPNLVFEGAQGVLLDEHVGFHPHTTWSTTTDHNIYDLLTRAGMSDEALEVIGVTRSYMTRHGQGPFVTEDASLHHPEEHNKTGEFMGPMRQGHLDLVALEYAIRQMQAVDSLYVTHTDLTPTRLGVGYIHPWTGRYRLQHLDPADVSARAQRTRQLFDVLPEYELLPENWDDYSELAARLGLELAGLGFGVSTTAGAFSRRMVKT